MEAAVELTQLAQSLEIFSEPANEKQEYRGLEKRVSLFGKLDIEHVNDDPFFIEPNTYHAICTDATVKESDTGDHALIIKWQIDEPGSDYHEKTLTDYFTLVDPDLEWEELDATQKDKVKFLKRRLRRAFGVKEADLNEVKPSELISREAMIEVVEGKGKVGTKNQGKKFTNIRDAMSMQLFEDEGHTRNSAAANSVGLL